MYLPHYFRFKCILNQSSCCAIYWYKVKSSSASCYLFSSWHTGITLTITFLNASWICHVVSFMDTQTLFYCEAQARVRQGSARDGSQGERPQSLKPCLELTLKLVATTHHHHHPPTRKSHYSSLMARQLSGEAGGGKGRCVGSLWVTLGSL